MADLIVDDLVVELDGRSGSGGRRVRVVDGVSLRLIGGRAAALVGESGSGKTLTALALLRLLPDGAHATSGSVRLVDEGGSIALSALDDADLRRARARVTMVFQEPMTALNPLLRVDDQVGEGLRIHQGASRAEARRRAAALLAELGVPATRARAYPHELSGGQRQRVMLAIALATGPDIVIADEPTTALDVTVQAQILALLKREQQRRGLALLLITHDLGVVAELCDDLYVMYAGRVVESGPVVDVFTDPRHPYTRALLASLPARAEPGRPLPVIPGQVPPPERWPSGCRFRDRCAHVVESCADVPPLVVSGTRAVRCVRALDSA